MKKFLGFLLVIFVTLGSNAAVAAHNPDGAKAFIETLGNDAVNIVAEQGLSESEKRQKLSNVIGNAVDFNWVAKYVLGRHWRAASDDQRKEFVPIYKDFLLKSYTARVKEYTSVSFKVSSVDTVEDNQYLVNTQIVRDSQAPVSVNYRVIGIQSGYRVVDMAVEGISLLATQRSEFNSIISQNGIDGLISRLQQKIDQQ